MRIYLTVIFLVLWASAVVAQPARQDTTLVFSRPGYDKDPIRANLRRVVEKKDSLWQVSLLIKKNKPFEQISFQDEQLSVRKGPYVRYQNEKVIETGSYEKGNKVGEWKHYDANGTLLAVYQYRWDKLYGPFTRFWPNGKPKEKGDYANDKLFGKHLLFYENGRVAADELYGDKGLLAGSYFDTEGKAIPVGSFLFTIFKTAN